MGNIGTRTIKFEAVPGLDVETENGVLQNISTRHQSISCMREYKDKSYEELRLEDYKSNTEISQQLSVKSLSSQFGQFATIGDSPGSSPFAQSSAVGTGNKFGTFVFQSKNSPIGKTLTFGAETGTSPFLTFDTCTGSSPFCQFSTFGTGIGSSPFGQSSTFGTGTGSSSFGQSSTVGTGNKFGTFVFDSKRRPIRKTLTGTKTASSPLPTFGASTGSNPFGQPSSVSATLSSKTGSSKTASLIENTNTYTGFKFGEARVFQFSGLEASSSHDVQDSAAAMKEKDQEEWKKFICDLQELIECPVCFASFDSSLKICENGHGLCSSCFQNVKSCPTCKQDYLPYNPLLLGQILERLPKPCAYADKGCKLIFFSKKTEHETFCKFRPTACKSKSCEWKGTVKDAVDHVKSCVNITEHDLYSMYFHKKESFHRYKFDKTQNVSFYSPIIFENQLFWKYFHRDCSTKYITHKFFHIPTCKPTKNYDLVVSFKKGDIEFSTCVEASYEMGNQPEEQEDNGVSFLLPDKYLERFYSSNRNCYKYFQKIIVQNISNEKT